MTPIVADTDRSPLTSSRTVRVPVPQHGKSGPSLESPDDDKLPPALRRPRP
jgi:hypothetical protein